MATMRGLARAFVLLSLLTSVQADSPLSVWEMADQYGMSWSFYCFGPGKYKEVSSMTLESCMSEGDKSGASFIAFSSNSTACRIPTDWPVYRDDCRPGFVLYEKKICCGIDCCGAYGYPSNSMDTTCCGAAQRPYDGVCNTIKLCEECTNIDGVYIANGDHSQVSWFKYYPGCSGSIDVDPYNYNPQKPHQFYYTINGSFVNSSAGVTGKVAPVDSLHPWSPAPKTITWSNGDVYKQLPICEEYPKDQCKAQNGEWQGDGAPCKADKTLVCSNNVGTQARDFYDVRVCCAPSTAGWEPCHGGICCNPYTPTTQYCPGKVKCQECGGSHACQCPGGSIEENVSVVV